MSKRPSRKQKLLLATVSDFSNFETSGIREDDERFSEDTIDPDIEAAIYARVYFDARDESHQKRLEGSVCAPHLLEEGRAEEEANSSGWSISFSSGSLAAPSDKVSPPRENTSEGKEKEGLAPSAVKLKRRRQSDNKRLKNDAKRIPPTDLIADANDFIVVDMYTASESTEVIDLTGDSVSSRSEAQAENKSSKDKSQRLKVKQGRRKKRTQGDAKEETDNPSREKQGPGLDSSAVEADIKRLFGDGGDIIMLSSDGEYSGEKGSSGGSSIESGELVGSGERSRVSSDMELCSDGSVELIKTDDTWKINEKDRLGAEAFERLHGVGDSVGRYYGQRNVKCTNCKQKGHFGKNCPWPKRHTVCYLCAGHNHISSTCPKNLCTYCYREKHRGVTCRVPWAGLHTLCTRCYMKGHHASICPDLWRQYHHTTYDSYDLVTSDLRHQMRNDKIYCSNCASKGHFGFECTRTIPRGNPAYHTPLIAFYDQNTWPPRDKYSLEIIQRALSSRVETSTPVPAGDGRKRAREEQEKIVSPNKKSRDRSPQSSGKKNRKKNKKFKNSEDGMKGKGSLLITIDGRGSEPTVGGHDVEYSSPPSVHSRARPSLLGAIPSTRDFPREPHPSHYHSPQEYDYRDQGAPSGNNRRGTWNYNSPGSTFTPGPSGRGMVSRSLSTGEHHLPSQHYRRHSEHLERYDHHQQSRHQHRDSMHPLLDTPTYPRPRNSSRGRLLSNRGFQMSLEAAGMYDSMGGNSAPAGSSQGDFRY